MARRTVVFDTNVLVAELAFPEEPPVCVALAESGAVEVAASPALLREFAAVLDYDHLPLATQPPERRARAVERAADLARVVEPTVRIDAAADADDDAVLEYGVTAAADAIVSDDSHLRERDGLAGLDVLTREAFLAHHADRRIAVLARRGRIADGFRTATDRDPTNGRSSANGRSSSNRRQNPDAHRNPEG